MSLRAVVVYFFMLVAFPAPGVLAQSLCVDKSPCAWERHNLDLARKDPDSVPAKRASLDELEGALLQCICRESWKGNFEPKIPGDPYDNDKVISFETAALFVELGNSLDASLLPYLHNCNSEFAPSLERATFTVTIATDGSVSDVTFIHSPTTANKPAQCMAQILRTRKYLPSNTVRGFEWTFTPMPVRCQPGIS